MNKDQIIEKFKGIFKTKVELAIESSFELADGTLMTSNGIELAVGVSVFSVDAEDNSTPMNDGNYDLADGTKLTVKDGMIETYGEYTPEVVVAEDEATPVENAEVIVEDAAPVEDAPKDEIEMLKSEIETLKSEIEKIYEMLNMSGDAVVEMRNEVEKVNTTLSKIPAEMGIQTKKVEKTNKSNDSRIEEFLDKVKNQKVNYK